MAIENEKKMKETLEEKNGELSKKLDTSENIVVDQKNKIEELESKVGRKMFLCEMSNLCFNLM